MYVRRSRVISRLLWKCSVLLHATVTLWKCVKNINIRDDTVDICMILHASDGNYCKWPSVLLQIIITGSHELMKWHLLGKYVDVVLTIYCFKISCLCWIVYLLNLSFVATLCQHYVLLCSWDVSVFLSKLCIFLLTLQSVRCLSSTGDF